MADLPFRMAVSLALTAVFEVLFALLLRKRSRKDILLVLLANMLTNPAVVYLYAFSTQWGVPSVPAKIVLEAAAILAEGFVYARYGWQFKRPYGFSLGANALSFTFGEIINRVL